MDRVKFLLVSSSQGTLLSIYTSVVSLQQNSLRLALDKPWFRLDTNLLKSVIKDKKASFTATLRVCMMRSAVI